MGEPVKGGARRTFVGVSVGNNEDPAKLSDALRSAASEAIAEGLVDSEKTAWFDVTFIEVELANQYAKTFRVGVSEKGGT